jgi:hypothetical protein
MSGWCPRCDAVTAADGSCPECGTPLVSVGRRAPGQPRPTELGASAEVSAEAAGPPSARLRVAVAVAAVVLIGLAFVAGRSTGHGPARAAVPTTAPTATTEAGAAPLAERRLDWRAGPVRGITVTALSVRRIAADDTNSDDAGQLSLQVQGLPAGRRLLALQGMELLDTGGGVFAGPDESPVAGTRAVLVQPAGQAGTYLVNLGPTPGVDTLARITLRGVVLSQPPSGRNRIELDTGGPWPARPPLRAVEPAADSVAIDLSPLRLQGFQGGAATARLPLEVAGVLVGGGRTVVTLRLGTLPGFAPGEIPRVFSQQVGAFPVSARLLAGDRVVCDRTTMFGESPDSAPLVVVDCPTAPVPRLAVEFGAGVQDVPFGVTLPA